LRSKLDVLAAAPEALDGIEALLARADSVKNDILRPTCAWW